MRCPSCNSSNTKRRGRGRRNQQRRECYDCGKTYNAGTYVDENAVESRYTWDHDKLADLSAHERFVVTSAQCNTRLDGRTWASIKRVAEERGAKLLVVPLRYRNPTSPDETYKTEREVWWPKEVEPYLIESEARLHDRLYLFGNIKTQATAENPLSGMEAFGGGASVIYGHAQIAMRAIPTPQYHLPKNMLTTGSVSRKNYSDTKTGWKGHFHHSLGAVYVEKEGSRFHMRVLNADRGGAVFDLIERFSPSGVKVFDRIPGLVTGDEHAGLIDTLALEGTYTREDSLVALTRPREIVRHDVFDGYSCSPWHARNSIVRFAKWRDGADDVEGELELTVQHIDKTTPKGTRNVIVASNHNEFLLRWLNDHDPKRDPRNAIIYHELMARVLRDAQMGPGGAEYPDPFALWARDRVTTSCKFLTRGESHLIKDIEVGYHADIGSGGAKGTPRAFARIGVKSIGGHIHVAGIEKGYHHVGTTGVLNPDYVRGAPSAMMHCHCLILPNGKRQLAVLVDGHYAHPDTIDRLLRARG